MAQQIRKEALAGQLTLQRAHAPRLRAGEIRIAPQLVGLCGSDSRIFCNEKAHRPGVFGHEVVAQVTEVGEGIRQFAVGDRVVVNPANQEDLHDTIGYNGTGFLTSTFTVEEAVVRQSRVFLVPASMPAPAAVFAEPLACCIHAQTAVFDRLRGANVLIVGSGSFGLLHSLLAKRLGAARVRVCARSPLRLNESVSRKIVARADTFTCAQEELATDEADVVIVTANGIEAVQWGLRRVASGGALILFGGLPTGARIAGMNVEELRRTCGNRVGFLGSKSISLRGSYGTNAAHFEHSLALLGERQLQMAVQQLVTHVLDFSDVQLALLQLGSGVVFGRPALKLLVKPS
jgi:L-iditol 2-dehydrogenase